MCLGAIPWSGIRRVITGATAEHAEAIGFDEGDKPLDWRSSLQKRGIEVISEIRGAEAKAVLNAYARQGGTLYNGACSSDTKEIINPGDHN